MRASWGDTNGVYRWARALGALALATSLAGCECDEAPRLDGPISVRIDDPMEVRGGTGRSIPGPARGYYVVFESAAGDPVPARHSTGCWSMPELVADEAHARVAWRCGESRDAAAWTIAYRDGADLLVHCSLAPSTIDWSAIPTHEVALPELVSCHPEPERLFRGARARGRDAVVELLLASRSAELHASRDTPRGHDAWEAAFLELSDAEKGRVRDVLRAEAAREGATSAALWRALLTGALDDSARLETRLAEVLAAAPWTIPERDAPGLTPDGPWEWLIAAGLRQLAEARTARAGELACTAVMVHEHRHLEMRQHAAIALAALRHPCPPLVASLASCSPEHLCRGDADGTRRLCTAEELLAAADAAMERDPIEAVRAPALDDGIPYFLAAASVGGVPEPILRSSRRLAYRVEPAEGPHCSAPELAPGDPCVCWLDEHAVYRSLCAMDTAGSDDSQDPRCELAIDDEARTIRVVRAATAPRTTP